MSNYFKIKDEEDSRIEDRKMRIGFIIIAILGLIGTIIKIYCNQ